MSATRKAFCNNIWCDDAADLPAAGQWVGQIAFIMDSPVVIKRWDGANWVDVTPDFPSSGSGGAIDPLTLNPYLWIDASAEVSYANNDPVSTATDQSGNGRDLAQSDGTKQPLYKTGIVNGLAVYRFDGSNDCLTRASVAVSAFTTFTVVRGTTAAGIIYELGADINSNDGIALYQDSPFIFVKKGGGTLSSRATGANWGIQNEWLICTQHYNLSGSHEGHSFWLHGWRPQYNTGTGSNPGISTTTATLNVGSRNNGGALPMNGDIAEFGIFIPAITTAQIEGVAQFLAEKYDI